MAARLAATLVCSNLSDSVKASKASASYPPQRRYTFPRQVKWLCLWGRSWLAFRKPSTAASYFPGDGQRYIPGGGGAGGKGEGEGRRVGGKVNNGEPCGWKASIATQIEAVHNHFGLQVKGEGRINKTPLVPFSLVLNKIPSSKS